jgi:hypothetical protein
MWGFSTGNACTRSLDFGLKAPTKIMFEYTIGNRQESILFDMVKVCKSILMQNDLIDFYVRFLRHALKLT